MKYCKKCKRIYKDGVSGCTVCGRAVCEPEDGGVPVYLLSASGFELSRVRAALEDGKIPCAVSAKKKSISAEAVTGSDNADYDLLVPLSAYEKAYDLCVGIGAIDAEDGAEKLSDMPEFSDVQQPEEMDPSKRRLVRIVSALLLIVLLCGVIWGVDALMNIIKGLL